MSKPTPGRPYTIVKGDTLWGIAAAAYGRGSRYTDIWAANKNSLISGDPNLIYPGEIVNIPKIPELEPISGDDILADDTRDDLTIVIEGKKLRFESARVIRTLDTPADGWAAEMLWSPQDPSLEEYKTLLKPYSYREARAYVGGHLMVTGYMYNVKPEIDPERSAITLEGFSKTADLIDTTIGAKKEFRNRKLADIADELIAKPHGIKVILDIADDGVFDRVKANPMQKIAEFMQKLAKQRGIVMSSTARGEAWFFRAAESGDPVASLGEGTAFSSAYKANFNGRDRYYAYKVLAQRRGAARKTAKAVDPVVPRTRVKAFYADDTTAGDMQRAADWERSKALVQALTLTFDVDGWHDPEGNIWRENTFVTVTAPSLFLPNGFTFLIRQVEYKLESERRSTTLSLVPPTVYSGGELVDPWA